MLATAGHLGSRGESPSSVRHQRECSKSFNGWCTLRINARIWRRNTDHSIRWFYRIRPFGNAFPGPMLPGQYICSNNTFLCANLVQQVRNTATTPPHKTPEGMGCASMHVDSPDHAPIIAFASVVPMRSCHFLQFLRRRRRRNSAFPLATKTRNCVEDHGVL